MKSMILNNKFNIILSFFVLYFLSTSCEKVVDIDLNEANPKPVFEAYMESDSFCHVRAMWTSSYYDNSTSPPIQNAVITISDLLGNTETLVHQGEGIYKGTTMIGSAGNTYTLNVALENNSYTASSYMHPLTAIDSFSIVPTGNLFGGGGGPGGGSTTPKFFIFVNYTDSVNYKDFYAIQTTYWDSVENDFVTAYRIADDDLVDGISTRAFTAFYQFERGDSVYVELASIDESTHLYFKTLEDAISGAGFASAAPANPTTNFSNGALGYFGAWTKDIGSFVIP